MRNSLVSLTLVATLGAGGAACAETSLGQIRSIDQPAHTVTLQDGTAYAFPRAEDDTPLTGLRAGDSVRIVWRSQGQTRIGESIGTVAVDHVMGRLKTMDPGASSVTLEDGRVFHFAPSDELRTEMASLRPGDTVRIAYHDGSGQLIGDSLGTGGATISAGVIRSVDASGVTLDDGKVYSFADSASTHDLLSTFKAGDHVQILWAPSGTARMGESISAIEG